jgi:hypothetical protein
MITLLYNSPSQGALPDKTFRISYSQEHKTNPPAPLSVAVAAKAPVAAVTFNNDTTEIFDLASGQVISRIGTTWYHKNKTFGNHFVLSPNGRILIGCVHMPRTGVMIWDVRTGELLRRRNLVQANHFHMSEGRYVIDSNFDGIGIYDLIKDEVICNMKGKEELFLRGISPDEKCVIGVGVRGHVIESWKLDKATDDRFSLAYGATEPVKDSSEYPFAIVFAKDDDSFYGTLDSSRHGGVIVRRRLPDLKEMHRLEFSKLNYVRLTEIKNTDIFLMEAWSGPAAMEAFYVDMATETAYKIPEHTGTNSKMAPLADGRVLLATPYALKTLDVPSKIGFGKFSDIIGEVISQDIPIKTADKENDKIIAPPQVNCRNSQIEAIGVYKGSLPNNRAITRGKKVAGYVDVTISQTDLPVKLILSSYEPVIWSLHISPDARLSEIYLSGSKDSRLQGAQKIMVSHIGDAFAYEDPNVSRSRYGHVSNLTNVVKQKTGCNITKFQGAYQGSNFYIGYITEDISEKKDRIYKHVDENGNVTYKNY